MAKLGKIFLFQYSIKCFSDLLFRNEAIVVASKATDAKTLKISEKSEFSLPLPFEALPG